MELNTMSMINKMMQFEIIGEVPSNNNNITIEGFKHKGSYGVIVSRLEWSKESRQYEYNVWTVITTELWEVLKEERFTSKADIDKDELMSKEKDKYQWLRYRYIDFLDNICISPKEWITIGQIEKRNNYTNFTLVEIYGEEYNVVYNYEPHDVIE